MFRESAQSQARHTIRVEKAKGPGATRSLRDQKHQIKVMGVLGAMHQKFGGFGGPTATVYSLFDKVEGLGAGLSDKEAKSFAERIYIPSITGDEAALATALEPLIARVAEYEAAHPADADAAEESFEPAIGVAGDGEGEEPSGPPTWCVRDARGIEPLGHAAANGHAAAAKLLLDARATVDAHASTCGRTALHRACEAGHVAVAAVLIEEGKADVLSTQANGQCALYSAAANGHAELVRYLLSEAVDAPADQADVLGGTPLSAACEAGHLEVVEALLSAPLAAELLARADAQGFTPLHHAVLHGHEEVAIALCKGGAARGATRGGSSLASLHAGIAAKLQSLFADDEDDEDDEDDDEGGGRPSRPYTAP